jgi:phosphatidylinositol glycan class V
MQTSFSTAVEKNPRILLIFSFWAWKLLLLAITLLSPGPDYDTSTQLLFEGHGTQANSNAKPQFLAQSFSAGSPLSVERLVERLTRWDAIYFVSIAERGYVHEQEWAFGWGFTRLLAFLSRSRFIISNHSYNPQNMKLVFHDSSSCPVSQNHVLCTDANQFLRIHNPTLINT